MEQTQRESTLANIDNQGFKRAVVIGAIVLDFVIVVALLYKFFG